MTYAYPPSFVLPPLPPGFAWTWTTRGWMPVPYTGPAWPAAAAAAPSSTAPSSTPASSSSTAPAADLLTDVPPWIAALADEDAFVARALGELYDAREAQLTAKHRAAALILRYGPAPFDPQSAKDMAQLARDLPDVAEALRAWEEAKRAADGAAAAVTAAAQRSAARRATLTAAPAHAPAPLPAAEITTQHDPPAAALEPVAESPTNPAPRTETATTRTDVASAENAQHDAPAADLLADVPPWIAALADEDAFVSRALGDLYEARAARRAAEQHAARLISACGPPPSGALSAEWIAQLARDRPDVAAALRAGAQAIAAAKRAEAALSQTIAARSPPSSPDASSPPATTTPAGPREPQEPPRDAAAAIAWAQRIAARDPCVAQALEHYRAAEEAARTTDERFAAVLARHGPLPEEPAARAEWARGLAESDPHAAAALRAGLAALEDLERAAAQLAEALSPHARAPPSVGTQ